MTDNDGLGALRKELFAVLAARFPQVDTDDVRIAIRDSTKNWKVTKARPTSRRDRVDVGPGDRDADAPYLTRWEITTPWRPLDEREQEVMDRQREAVEWQYGGREKRRKVPPPPGVSILSLLEQAKWWQPGGRDPVKLKDMEPEYRANLLDWLWARAQGLHFQYLAGAFSEGAPDEVMNDAEHEMTHGDHHQWLRGQPLYARLKKLVDRDRAAATAQDAPVGGVRTITTLDDPGVRLLMGDDLP